MVGSSHNFSDDDGEVRLTRAFVGRFRPAQPRNMDHADGFDRAIRAALDEADRAFEANVAQLPDAPKVFHARITLEAEVEVRSPGNVGEYRAIVTEH
jgi:hypothetical protein